MAEGVDTFSWGIVGTGGIARQFASDLKLLPEARLGAVSSRDLGKARQFQAEFGAGRAYSEIEALLDDESIDAVYIATPNSLHAEHALLALARRKPVLVEKPLAVSAAEAERIEAAAGAGKCFAMEAMWTRFLPAIRAAKKLVDGGTLGRVKAITAELSYFREERPGSRFFDPHMGGGAALDLGVYTVSLALHFLGRPSNVSGSCRRAASGVDIRAEMRLEFDGAVANLSCGFDREGANEFTIEGTDGALRIGAPFLKAQRLTRFTPAAFALTGQTAAGPRGMVAKVVERLPLPGRHAEVFSFPGNGLQFEAAAVMDAVRRGANQSDVMPLGESVAALRIIDTVLSKRRP